MAAGQFLKRCSQVRRLPNPAQMHGCLPSLRLAIFIVPYIQLVFGVETIQRAFRRYPFPQRLKYTVPACLAIVVVGLIGTYVLTRFVLPPDFCFASLFWFVRRWALGCFVLTTTIASILLIGSVITLVRLYRTAGINETQRIAASWMACYMLLATATLVSPPSLRGMHKLTMDRP